MSRFESFCKDLIDKALAAGWEEREQRNIDYGRQYRLAQGGAQVAVLSCYEGKKGLSFVVGGALKDQLSLLLGEAPRKPKSDKGKSAGSSSSDPFELGFPRVGGDESGKGDYFGPVVAALYRVDEEHAEELLKLGIADSKRIPDSIIEPLAEKLTATGRGVVVSIPPPEYNARYAALGNINQILGEMYADCWEAMHAMGDEDPSAVIIDRYTTRSADLAKKLALPAGVPLEMRPKGEADVAVAAASVLARAAFLNGLRDLGHDFGEKIPLGAGAPVLKFGRRFVTDFGAQRLGAIAKLHFATTGQIT